MLDLCATNYYFLNNVSIVLWMCLFCLVSMKCGGWGLQVLVLLESWN